MESTSNIADHRYWTEISHLDKVGDGEETPWHWTEYAKLGIDYGLSGLECMGGCKKRTPLETSLCQALMV